MSAAIGLDVGTSSVKGIAIDERGRVLARAEAEHPTDTPRAGWSEQDPEAWWRGSEQVLAALVEQAGRPRGIGLSGQMHGLVALDAAGAVVRPAMLWNDQRTGAQCDAIEEAVGAERLIELTGNRALASFTAPKLLWLREHEPSAHARIATVMLPKDYVRLRLTGERSCDVTDASGTLLFDVGRRAWSPEVARAIGVDTQWLPPAQESPEVSGHTRDGLPVPAGIPVAAGAGDQAAGALGVGVDSPGPASVVLGTSGVVFAALEGYAADSEARVQVFCHAVPGSWHAMGVMLSAAGSLGWLRRVMAPRAGWEDLLAAAGAWPPGAEGLTFLPYLSGERTPHADPSARGAFTGLSQRHDLGALVRAVLEGVAFGLRDCLDAVVDTGARPRLGRVSGGGARSDLWLRIVASALELPLERTAVEEGAAFGAALLGATAAGVFDDPREAVSATVAPGDLIEPDPEWAAVYAGLHGAYRELYPALHPRTAAAGRRCVRRRP